MHLIKLKLFCNVFNRNDLYKKYLNELKTWKWTDEDKLRVKMAERKSSKAGSDKTKKKSRFQEKLEEMQRKQLEMNKNKK